MIDRGTRRILTKPRAILATALCAMAATTAACGADDEQDTPETTAATTSSGATTAGGASPGGGGSGGAGTGGSSLGGMGGTGGTAVAALPSANEIDAASGRLTGATYALDFQLGRAVHQLPANAGDVAIECAAPIH